MKKKLVIAVGFVVSVTLISCTGAKNVVKDETLIETYCSGDEQLSNKDYFRSNGIGESMDQMTARQKARSNAQNEMAKSIKSTMKVVGDNYVNSTEVNNKEEVTETFNEMTRTIVDQELNGAVKICEKFTKTKEGNYKCYLALELSAANLLKKYNESLSSDDKIKADYNYETFKKTFEEEMNKQKK
ncbi:MAG TPA: hypothetical protein VK177_12050 [Flavobacteriales bacterium]|nr:hypothetical protein [Flavobacteriales bacterium]